MKYSETAISGGVEILASNDFQAIPATLAVESDATSTVVLAGTPIDASGLATESAPIGILLYDVDTAVNPNGAVVVDGIVDATKAASHSGVTYSDTIKGALPNIIFRTNIGVNV